MIITGTTISRLNELRKYSISNLFTDRYVSRTGAGVDGVDFLNSIEGERVVYYIGDVKYIDLVVDSS